MVSVEGGLALATGENLHTAYRRHRLMCIRESAESEDDWLFPRWWKPIINYVVPVIGIVIFSWWMWISATVYAPDDWYDPTSLYSVATCVVQWGIVIGVFYGSNRWINQRLENPLN